MRFCQQKNAIYVTVKDDAMQPVLYPGDYVGGIISDNIKRAIGKDAIIVDENHDVYIRRLENSDKKNNYTLVGINNDAKLAKPIIQDINVHYIAPIIWIRRS